MSECYKSVTKELMTRTLSSPTESTAETVGYARADLPTLLSLVPPVVLNYSQARSMGLTDTFAVLLRAYIEENLVLLVAALLLVLALLSTGVVVVIVLLIRKQQTEGRK